VIDARRDLAASVSHRARSTNELNSETTMQRVLAAALLLLLSTAGCVIVGDPTCSGSSASVVVAPGVVVVTVGQSFTPSGSESWCEGGHQAHGSPNWALSQAGDSAFVMLDATTGRITGRRAGFATVIARSDHSGATSSILVTVR